MSIGCIGTTPNTAAMLSMKNDLVYHIANIEEDDAVGYIDFESFHHRNNPRPMLEVGSRAVWPVNVDVVKRDSLEVLHQVPADDRPLPAGCDLSRSRVPRLRAGHRTPRAVGARLPGEGCAARANGNQRYSPKGRKYPQHRQRRLFIRKVWSLFRKKGRQNRPFQLARHASHDSHASHAPGHIGNSCGTGPMPANWPRGCGKLNCTGYYKCEEYGPPSGDCVRWSGPYGRGGEGQTFCDKYGQEWATREDYSAAVRVGNVEGRSFPLEIYCASPVSWKNLCDSGDIGDCSLAWEDCDLDSNGEPFTVDTASRCASNTDDRDKGKPCRAPPSYTILTFEHMHGHCIDFYASDSYMKCGYLPYPEGWTGDWPPAGFTKQ